ncbi:hypothetical protein [Streptomyces pristinaespiralis]|uniref:hypothetical protein n=1 Tax=Streptomyces pristinaespiralis TaxID=38300 RepID=UPI003836DA08
MPASGPEPAASPTPLEHRRPPRRHVSHRPVRAEHAERTQVFLGRLGSTRKTERTRLRIDFDRAARVVAEIDAVSGAGNDEKPA